MSTRRLATCCGVALAVLLLGCGVKSTPLDPVATTAPGKKEVYDRIKSKTDCNELQAEFDTAEKNHRDDVGREQFDLAQIDLSYMEAADSRMRELGCP